MPTATRNDVAIHYSVDGDGDGDRSPVVFCGDCGFGPWQWGWQHPAVAGRHSAVVWSLRGVDRSDPPPEGYPVPAMGADLEAVLADAGLTDHPVHLVGAGLGGAVALEYALDRGRVRTLTLFGGTADGSELPRESVFAPPDDPKALRDSLSTVLSGAFREAQPDVVEAIAGWRADEDADRRAWETHTAALAGFDVTGRLYECTRPTLVVHGGADRTVPADAGRRLAEGLPRGRVETFEGAGHLVGVERSRPVNDLLIGHLDEHDDV